MKFTVAIVPDALYDLVDGAVLSVSAAGLEKRWQRLAWLVICPAIACLAFTLLPLFAFFVGGLPRVRHVMAASAVLLAAYLTVNFKE